jgi:aminoglycoside 3-N-acetyltransferase I
MKIRRLRSGDDGFALATFAMMDAVFREADDDDLPDANPLDNAYVARLLERDDFFVLAALEEGSVVGGVTGHVLPMTRSQCSELFIYDLAVRTDRQRSGIGRALVTELCDVAAALGITTSFVPADNEDAHAIAFYRSIGGNASAVTFFTFVRRGAHGVR